MSLQKRKKSKRSKKLRFSLASLSLFALTITSALSLYYSWDPWVLGKVLKGYKSPINAIFFSPNEKFVAASDFRGGIRLWDLDSGKEVFEFSPSSKINRIDYPQQPPSLCFSHNEDKVAFVRVRESSPISVWSIKPKKLLFTIGANDRYTSQLQFSSDDKKIYTGHPYKINTWDSTSA